jgi:Ca2+-binding RTX toxin-like protein
LSGDFSLIPEIRILSNGELGTANGAYAASLDEILVSSDFLAQHQNDLAAVVELLLEEIGHKLDTVLNGNVDSLGDEGKIFRLLVIGYNLSSATLAGLKTQDDRTVITVDGQSVAVETQDFPGTDVNDTLIGTDGDDTFSPLKGADSIDGRAGTDLLTIDNSIDTAATAINYTTSTNGTITGGSNNGTTFQNIERVNFTTGSGNDNINVSAATSASVNAGAGNDTLNGGAGNNSLIPGTGADVINGGTGNSQLEIANSRDTASTTINYTTLTNGTVTGGANDGTTFNNIKTLRIFTGSGNDNINASAGSGDGVIRTESGNDTITGGAGNDFLIPGTGADVVNGGTGNNRLQIDNRGNTDNMTINYTTLTNGTVTGGANNGTTFNNIKGRIEIITGSGNNNINVSAATSAFVGAGTANDTIVGGAGDDTLDDRGGANNLSGGDGNDTYVFNPASIGGTVIDDSSGTNDRLEYPRGVFPTLTTSDISRNGTTLLIDVNKDGVFNAAADLSINNYFADTTSSLRGTGFIENLFGVNKIRNDFNGDGKSDILWRNTDGSIAQWQMNGTTVTPKAVGSLTDDWTIAGSADFNGDGKADMLLSNTNGSIATWQLNGSTVTQSSMIGSISPDWKIAGTDDFNGDGKSDLLFQNTNGSVAQWLMNGSTVTATAIVGTPTPDWKVAGTGDFNGDGKSDLLFQNNDGRIAQWLMNGSTVLAAQVIAAITPDWKIAGIGDFSRGAFSGDGKADLLFRNTNGSVAEWQMDGSKVISTSVVGTSTADWKITGTGDFNGDGKADILWRNDLGDVAEWQMDGTILSGGLTSIPTADPAWKIAAPIL